MRAYGTGGARESMARIGAGTATGTGGRDVISAGELRDEGTVARDR